MREMLVLEERLRSNVSTALGGRVYYGEDIPKSACHLALLRNLGTTYTTFVTHYFPEANDNWPIPGTCDEWIG